MNRQLRTPHQRRGRQIIIIIQIAAGPTSRGTRRGLDDDGQTRNPLPCGDGLVEKKVTTPVGCILPGPRSMMCPSSGYQLIPFGYHPDPVSVPACRSIWDTRPLGPVNGIWSQSLGCGPVVQMQNDAISDRSVGVAARIPPKPLPDSLSFPSKLPVPARLGRTPHNGG